MMENIDMIDMKKIFEVRLLSELSKEEMNTIDGVQSIIDEYDINMDDKDNWWDIKPYNVAVVIYKNKIIDSFDDHHGHSEDLTFGRDLLDFLKLAETAFDLGVGHGIAETLKK
jgi:hypothetical protein